MSKNYSTYIENLKGRRYDEVLHGPSLSNSFESTDYPDPVKYGLEAMKEIDPSYSYKLFSSFRTTQNLLAQRLKLVGKAIDVRYVGAHNTETHVELYGDLELLIVLRKFKKASADVQGLGNEIVNILTAAQAYNSVDYSDQHRILVQLRKPQCNVVITPCIWVDSTLYKKSHLEINRSICEYNFESKKRKIYLPFLNMARVNSRSRKLSGSLKAIIRLLRSLMMDSENNIDLSYDDLVGLVYNMSVKELAVPKEQYLGLLPNISLHLQRVITDDEFRQTLLSPSRKEYVFGKLDKVSAIQVLKNEIDEYIADVNSSLKSLNKSIVSPLDF